MKASLIIYKKSINSLKGILTRWFPCANLAQWISIGVETQRTESRNPAETIIYFNICKIWPLTSPILHRGQYHWYCPYQRGQYHRYCPPQRYWPSKSAILPSSASYRPVWNGDMETNNTKSGDKLRISHGQFLFPV